MFRFCKLGLWYGVEIESVKADLQNIEDFAESATPIILVDDVEDFQNLTGLEEGDFEIA